MTSHTLEQQILFYSNANVFISGTQTGSLRRDIQFRLPPPPAGSRCDLGLDSANLPRAAESLPLSAPSLSLSLCHCHYITHRHTHSILHVHPVLHHLHVCLCVWKMFWRAKIMHKCSDQLWLWIGCCSCHSGKWWNHSQVLVPPSQTVLFGVVNKATVWAGSSNWRFFLWMCYFFGRSEELLVLHNPARLLL